MNNILNNIFKLKINKLIDKVKLMDENNKCMDEMCKDCEFKSVCSALGSEDVTVIDIGDLNGLSIHDFVSSLIKKGKEMAKDTGIKPAVKKSVKKPIVKKVAAKQKKTKGK